MVFDHGFGDAEEGLGTAGTAVIDAGLAAILPEPEVNLADVLDIDEVAQLPAIAKTVAAFEQFRILAILHLIV